eukprot:CAMPEP_0113956634 /NCGR_PEP_ID=MMETSP0011_2-20120614/2190_1 /TAXON_ID=101924 /ORGANISM="Rhodosorus marinus" /LENGTH=391 /DNA_ID=CAMNT_0000966841 /DNA_START=332 /DNA_END=1507 /DNA_ORIENTATION=- /assembly_acc=CAM_ASM_000156
MTGEVVQKGEFDGVQRSLLSFLDIWGERRQRTSFRLSKATGDLRRQLEGSYSPSIIATSVRNVLGMANSEGETQAAEFLETALEATLDKLDVEDLVLISIADVRRRRYNEALSLLRKARGRSSSLRVYNKHLDSYFLELSRVCSPEVMKEHLDVLIGRSSQYPDYQRHLYAAYARSGRAVEAAEDILSKTSSDEIGIHHFPAVIGELRDISLALILDSKRAELSIAPTPVYFAAIFRCFNHARERPLFREFLLRFLAEQKRFELGITISIMTAAWNVSDLKVGQSVCIWSLKRVLLECLPVPEHYQNAIRLMIARYVGTWSVESLQEAKELCQLIEHRGLMSFEDKSLIADMDKLLSRRQLDMERRTNFVEELEGARPGDLKERLTLGDGY